MDKISMITLLLARAYTDKKTSEVPAVIQYKGVTTTALSDGATTNPITINGSSYTAVNGDTVFYDGVAYTFDGTVWQETVSLAQIITELEGLDEKIGDLSDLTTTDKDSVVDAINELVTDVGGKVDKVEGKGLSTNDYTDADKAIVGGVTAALAGKQDTLTFDDTPTDNSNNPVKSNGIYDALALKQDKTDNTLQTTSKTVVGGINELKSGLTNLKTVYTTTSTGTYRDKLNSMYNSVNNMSVRDDYYSTILFDDDVYRFTNKVGTVYTYTTSYFFNSKFFIRSIGIDPQYSWFNSVVLDNNGNTISTDTQTENAKVFTLYV